jgi:hypothetical protein
MIFALGLLIGRVLGEDLIGKIQNEFDLITIYVLARRPRP